MNEIFNDELRLKTTQDLNEIVSNRSKYSKTYVKAVKRELANRSDGFPIDIGLKFENLSPQPSFEIINSSTKWNVIKSILKRNISIDSNVPRLYSKSVIINFSIFFLFYVVGYY